jgi:hypothetical protein
MSELKQEIRKKLKKYGQFSDLPEWLPIEIYNDYLLNFKIINIKKNFYEKQLEIDKKYDTTFDCCKTFISKLYNVYFNKYKIKDIKKYVFNYKTYKKNETNFINTCQKTEENMQKDILKDENFNVYIYEGDDIIKKKINKKSLLNSCYHSWKVLNKLYNDYFKFSYDRKILKEYGKYTLNKMITYMKKNYFPDNPDIKSCVYPSVNESNPKKMILYSKIKDLEVYQKNVKQLNVLSKINNMLFNKEKINKLKSIQQRIKAQREFYQAKLNECKHEIDKDYVMYDNYNYDTLDNIIKSLDEMNKKYYKTNKNSLKNTLTNILNSINKINIIEIEQIKPKEIIKTLLKHLALISNVI